MADVLIGKGFRKEEYSWGNSNLTAKGKARKDYLSALRKADKGDYNDLIHFSRM